MPRALTRVPIEHHDDAVETRDAIKDIWGPRTGYNAAKGVEWPVRVDQHTSTEPDKWVQSACVMYVTILILVFTCLNRGPGARTDAAWTLESKMARLLG
jgi:hypothetical protein